MFNLHQIIRGVQTKLFNMIKKGYITLPTKNSGTYSSVQVKYLKKSGNAQPIYPYGMLANPSVNSMCLLFNLNAHEDNLAAICYTQKNNYEITLDNSETLFGNPESGSYIRFLANGDIEIKAKNNVTINGVEINTTGKVNLGAGGSAIARTGDAVLVDGKTGSITGGSGNNTSN